MSTMVNFKIPRQLSDSRKIDTGGKATLEDVFFFRGDQ